MTSYDQHLSSYIVVDEICHLTDQQQAGILADKFSSVSKEYSPLLTEDISVSHIQPEEIPIFTPQYVMPYLQKIKINKSNLQNDIAVKMNTFAIHILIS